MLRHEPGRGRVRAGVTRESAVTSYLVNGRAKAAVGVKSSLLRTTKRSDGRLQVTYGGRPLYYYVGDRKPGQVLCQNVNVEAVTAAARLRA